MGSAPAIVTPLDDHMGLDISRSLARHGVTVFGLDWDSTIPGRYSKYCNFVQCPKPTNETEYVNALINFGKELKTKAVLFPLDDRVVLICSRYREILQDHFLFVMPDHETMEALTTKDGLRDIALELDFPAPQTNFVHCNNGIENFADETIYPVILKPVESTFWHTPQIENIFRSGILAGRAKVVLCNNPTDLINSYNQIACYDNRLVVQEVIPGDDSELIYVSFYLNRQSEVLGIFAGRKYRILPTGFGSASYVRSCNDPKFKELAIKLLSATQYKGLGGIEFKRDPRDGQYKLIEFNTRFGMWDGLGAKCGVDLAYIAYCDALDIPVESQMDFRDEVIWIDLQRDIRASIEYMRKGEMSLHQWLRSLRGEKKWAIYSSYDWRPGVAFTIGLICKMRDRLTGR